MHAEEDIIYIVSFFTLLKRITKHDSLYGRDCLCGLSPLASSCFHCFGLVIFISASCNLTSSR